MDFVTKKGKPLYKQLYSYYAKKIAYGELKCGDRLPSYDQFNKEYGLARQTIRRAYILLQNDGYINIDYSGAYVCETAADVPIMLEHEIVEIIAEAKDYYINDEVISQTLWKILERVEKHAL